MDAVKVTSSTTKPQQKIRCNQTLSLRDAFANSLMVGASESYFAAFVLFLGFSETLTGIFASLPLALGAAAALFTPWGLRRMGSMKRWVVTMVGFQVMALLMFAMFAAFEAPGSPYAPAGGIGTLATVVLFSVASLYWAASYSAGSVWNRWMADLIHHDESSHFFTRRLRSTQYGTLLGLLLAGYILSHGLNLGSILSSFAILFLIGAISRSFSGYAVSFKDDGVFARPMEGLPVILKRFWRPGEERDLILFLFLFGVGVYASSPFVNPFLLGKLQFSPFAYSIALIALFLGKIVGFTVTHRYLAKWTSEKAMILGALGISPLPALWIVATSPTSAALLQAFSGFAWGIYEASLALILFRKLRNESKVALMSLISFIQCMAILGGGLLGGSALKFFGEDIFAYNCIFALSSGLRMLICGLFAYTWLYAKGRKVQDSVVPPGFDLKLR